MMQAVVVVPCYNEEKRLNLQAFAAFMELEGERFGFLFVDDGSKDNTRAMLEAFCQGHSQASYLSLERNRGKAEAVRQGLCEAVRREVPFVGYFDADLATPLAEIPSLLAPMERQAGLEVVMGSRVKLLGRNIQRKLMRHYLGRIFATTASMLLRLPTYDTQCGAKLFRRTPRLETLLQEPFVTNWIFDVELLVRFLRAGGRAEQIYEHPLLEWRDVAGSKVGHRDFLRAGLELARLTRRYRLLGF